MTVSHTDDLASLEAGLDALEAPVESRPSPLRKAFSAAEGGGWVSEAWRFRRGGLFLAPGDSPVGLRLPLDSLPELKPKDYPHIVPLDPYEERPPLPMPVTAGRRRDLGMSDRERDAISARVQTEGLCLMGLRFTADSASPSDRFRALRAAFGDGWLPVGISSRPGNPAGIGKREHKVLTSKDVETPGHPTNEARAQVVAFLRERLGAGDRSMEAGAQA